jgi:hypothetical protein
MGFQIMASSTKLTTDLKDLPQEWALTPVKQKKAYFAGWQQTGLSKESIEQEITTGRADGFGILTGEMSNGLIAIDCDGHEPHARLREILGGDFPETVSFASGKDGRAQYLYSVPQDQWANISTKKEGDANNGGQLEWRWGGCYSVLPPSAHPETDGYYWVKSPDECSIAPLPDQALEHLLNLCKPKVSQAKPSKNVAPTIPPIPLERCLSIAHRQALENGVGEGGRNDTAISLARDLLGCAAWLDALEEPYSGDAQSLYIEYCDRCSPPIKDVERDATWRSANKYSPEPSINDAEAFQNCIDKWKRDNGQTTPAKPVTAGEGVLNASAIVREELRKMVESSTGSELTTKLLIFAAESKFQYSSVIKLAEQIQDEITQAEDDPSELKNSIDKKLEIITKDFPLAKLFPEKIAQPLAEYCQGTAAPQGLMAMSLITCLASLQHPKTNLRCFGNTDRRAKPIFWLGVYGISGNGKTHSYAPPLKAVKKLGENHNVSHDEKLKEWELVQRKVKNKKATDIDPVLLEQSEEPRPDRERYWVGDVTIEALLTRCAKQQDRGLLLYSPELLGWCLRMDPAKGEVEYWLSLWDGDSVEGDRIGREFPPLTHPSISVMGGVQPDVMSKLIAKGEDIQNGFMPRLALVRFEEVPKPALSEAEPPDFSKLEELFKAVADTREPIEIKLDPSCFSTSDEWDREMDNRRLSESRKSIKPLFPKFNGYSYRIALMIHIIQRALDPSQPDDVPLSTFKSAIEFTRWLLGQSISVYEELIGEAKEDEIAKFLNSNKYTDWITVRQFHKPNWRKYKTANDARRAIEELITLGYLQSNGEKITSKKFKFRSVDTGSRGHVDRTPGMPVSKAFEPSTVNVDAVDNKSRNGHLTGIPGGKKSVDKFQENADLKLVHPNNEPLEDKSTTDLSTELPTDSKQDRETVADDKATNLSTPSTGYVDGSNGCKESDAAILSTCPRDPVSTDLNLGSEEEQSNHIPLGELEDEY